jgi:hypothetical protein
VYLLKLPSVTTTTAIFVLSNDAHEIPGDVSDVVHIRGFHFRDNFFHRRGVANLRQGGEHALVDGVSLETAFLNTSDYSVRVRWERTSERLIVYALAAVAATALAAVAAATSSSSSEVIVVVVVVIKIVPSSSSTTEISTTTTTTSSYVVPTTMTTAEIVPHLSEKLSNF